MRKATKETLLGALPTYRDEWVLVHPSQTVKDIIAEVAEAHKEFAPFYDQIALYFDSDDVGEICRELFRFCKKNFRYREESEDEQTTASPQGLLTWGATRGVDCKHYSGFCGGVLDALNRMTGKNIEWCYRFASYNVFNRVPHHVFIVVSDDGVEHWIDPTPGANEQQPIWQIDKKIKSQNMALHRNIGALHRNVGSVVQPEKIGLVVTPAVNVNTINYDGSGKYNGVFGPYLGLMAYAEYESSIGTDWNALANQINQLIAQGPDPGHTVSADFVHWVFDSNLRSWNFYYRAGVQPGFADHVNDLLPASWPKPVVTADNRLTLDRDVQVDDYRNPEIHVLTAALQDLINRYDATPYPLKPRSVKLFTQKFTGNPNNTTASFFTEWRGTSDVTKALHKINKWVNVVKGAVLKVVGAIPRNAFLGLVGMNAFGMATHLQAQSDGGNWPHIRKIWKGLGGNPSKLQSTIAHGAGKPKIEDTTAEVGEQSLTGETLGAIQLGAILAAAAPIIAALAKFIGNVHPAVQQTSTDYLQQLNAANPGHTFTYDSDGTLLMDGKPVDTVGDHTMRNAAIAAGVSLAAYYLMNKRRTGKKKILIPAAAGVGTYFAMNYFDKSEGPAYNLPTTTTVAPKTGFTSSELVGILQVGADIFSQISDSSSGDSSPSSDYALPVDYTPGGDWA